MEESGSEALFEKISGRRELVSLLSSDKAGHGEGMAAGHSMGLKRGSEYTRWKPRPGAGGVAGERGRTVGRGPWWSIFMETQGSRTVNRGAENGSPPPEN